MLEKGSKASMSSVGRATRSASGAISSHLRARAFERSALSRVAGGLDLDWSFRR